MASNAPTPGSAGTPPPARDAVRVEPVEHPLAAKIAFLACVGAGLLPPIIMGFSTPMMQTHEMVIDGVVTFGGGLLAFFMAKRRPIAGLAIIPVVLVLSVSAFSIFTAQRTAKLAPFRARLREFVDLKLDPAAAQPVGQHALRRKMLAIDQRAGQIDNLQLLLPEELCAAAPDEVGTLLWLQWGEETTGKYPAGGRAIRRYCDVILIDFAAPPRLIGRTRIVGGEPPDKGSSSDLYGSPPLKQIIQYLRSTPSP